MLKFRWNALRRGDPVVVHDTIEHGFTLRNAEVVLVESVPGCTNAVGVRVEDGSGVSRPARLTVHLDPPDQDEHCWRCDVVHSALHGARTGGADTVDLSAQPTTAHSSPRATVGAGHGSAASCQV